jgi:hypothetical protein
MPEQCTEERFLMDTKHHTLEILRNDGLHRHLRIRKNHSMVYGYHLGKEAVAQANANSKR